MGNLSEKLTLNAFENKGFTFDLLDHLDLAFLVFNTHQETIVFKNKKLKDWFKSLSIQETDSEIESKLIHAYKNKAGSIQIKVENDIYGFQIKFSNLKKYSSIVIVEFKVLPIYSEDLLTTYQKFMDNSPNSIFSKNRSGVFTFCNIAFAKFYNSTPSEIIGKKDSDFHYTIEKSTYFQNQDLEVMDSKEPLFIPLVEVPSEEGQNEYYQTLKVPVIGKDGTCNEILGFANLVTERVLAEKSLEKSESMFRNLYNKSPIGVLLEDDDETMIANPEFCKLSGYSREELRELKMSNIIVEKDQQEYFEKVSALAKGDKESINLELKYIKKDGSFFHGNVFIGVMRTKNKAPRYLSFIEDITLKKMSEAALFESNALLKTSEERFRKLFEQSPYPMTLKKLDSKYYSLTNHAFANLLEYSIEETLTKKITDFVLEEDLTQLKEKITDLRKGKINKFSLNKKFQTKTGEIIITVVTQFLVTYQGEEHLGTVIEDVTDLYNTMDALQDSESKYRKLYDNAFDGLITIDIKSKQFTQCNESAVKLFGYNSELEFCRANLSSLIADQDNNESPIEFVVRIYEEMKNAKTFNFSGKAKRKDGGTFYANINVVRSDSPNDHIIFLMIKDITSQVKAATDKKLATEQKAKIERQRLELDSRNRELASYTMYLQQKNRMLHDLNDYLEEIQQEAECSKIRSKLDRVLRQISRGIDQQNDWKSFKIYFERIHPDFFYMLRQKINNLSQNELKHCAYIKMNLSQKEVADLLYVQPKTVEVARYRLKKKLNLGPSDNLINFIQAL